MTKPKNPTPEQLQAYRDRRNREKRDRNARKAQAKTRPKTLPDLKRERDEARENVHIVDRECQRNARMFASHDPGPGTWLEKYRAEWARQLPRLIEARVKRDAAIRAYLDRRDAEAAARREARANR